MIPCAASLRRSFRSWYLPLRLSSKTSALRLASLPSASPGSPVNIAAYSLDSVDAAESTSVRYRSAASSLGTCGSTGSRCGRRSATVTSVGGGGRHSGTNGSDIVTAKSSVAEPSAAAQDTAPGGTASSVTGFPASAPAGSGRHVRSPYAGA